LVLGSFKLLSTGFEPVGAYAVGICFAKNGAIASPAVLLVLAILVMVFSS
jgi:ABC-type branched-subunit amino acid transport system permease subunit